MFIGVEDSPGINTASLRNGEQKTSYTTALTIVTKSLTPAGTVQIDVAEAFDAAWHPAIITQLHRLDCPAYMVRFIGNYLTARTATLTVQGHNFQNHLERIGACPHIPVHPRRPSIRSLGPFLPIVLYTP